MSDFFYITSELNCLVLQEGTDGRIITWPLQGTENQQFKLSPEGYIFTRSGKVLDLEGGVHQGHQVIAYNYLAQPNQKWRMEKSGIISLEGQGLMLDIQGCNREQGVNVIGWSFNGNLNQRWKFVPVDESKTYPQVKLTGEDKYLFAVSGFKSKAGLSSDAVRSNSKENRCLKIYGHQNTFERETKYNKLLSGSEHFPTYIAQAPNRLLTDYCGRKIQSNTIPHNVEEQIRDIIEVFRRFSIVHNDIHPKNILVLDGKIKLVDFAFMDEIKNGRFHLIPKSMATLVRKNCTDEKIRLAGEAECFRLSIEYVRRNPTYTKYSRDTYNQFFTNFDC